MYYVSKYQTYSRGLIVLLKYQKVRSTTKKRREKLSLAAFLWLFNHCLKSMKTFHSCNPSIHLLLTIGKDFFLLFGGQFFFCFNLVVSLKKRGEGRVMGSFQTYSITDGMHLECFDRIKFFLSRRSPVKYSLAPFFLIFVFKKEPPKKPSLEYAASIAMHFSYGF